MKARCLSILGTGSDVGKSIVVTALCRLFQQAGVRVAPFKAQNMSNNSFVTWDGGEMGRAQVVQAEAARVEPHVKMNPVLLKPATNTGSQVVVMGKPVGTWEANQYFSDTTSLAKKASACLHQLREEYEWILMEGAGSCAEVNLRDRDFVNFRMAHEGDASVILVADIDRGGVFAQIIGTLALLSPEDRSRVKGILINRFRGDPALFQDGIETIERKTGLPVLGLIPTYRDIEIESEDGLPLDGMIDPSVPLQADQINLAVIRLPHISNFTDFSVFSRNTATTLHYLSKPRSLAGYDFVFLPGTKNVRFDLDWLRATGWDRSLWDYVKTGGKLGGLCGGYQMLGRVVNDPYGVEGNPGSTQGLNWLDVKTTLQKNKTLCRSQGFWKATGDPVEGYEIHMGETEPLSPLTPLIEVTHRQGQPVSFHDGVQNASGQIWGTYYHGLFDSSPFRTRFLQSLKKNYADRSDPLQGVHYQHYKDQQYDKLADHFRRFLRLNTLETLLEVDLTRPKTLV